MKIFTCEQIRNIDESTIIREPVSSPDLMERAAGELFRWYISRFNRTRKIILFAGPGNNGGDGMVLARLLSVHRYDVEVYLVKFTDKVSADFERNRQRLLSETEVTVNDLESIDLFPSISSQDIVVDAIFGSGLARPVTGFPAEVIREINKSDCLKIAVDMPSGLFGEDNSQNMQGNVIKADFTLSFQFPRLSFMFSENNGFTGEWFILDIGLDAKAISETVSPYRYVERTDVAPMIRIREKFDHKGRFGHGLLVAGSQGKTGACILAAGAALRSGIGLLTCNTTSSGSTAINCAVPEAMVRIDNSAGKITENIDLTPYSAVGIGPGIGTCPETQTVMSNLLDHCKSPLVVDADAINILAMNKEWLFRVPAGTILTPHMKEFERLAGKCSDGFSRLNTQIRFSKKHKCIIVLKGACTSITTDDGRVFFNSTGNPGMATAGSGDVLTGIILSLLAQGHAPVDAAVLGVYLHGLAGDIAAGETGYESLIASDIINSLGKAFIKIREN